MKNVISADFKKHAHLNARRLTNAQIASIRAQGFIVVCRPDNLQAQAAKETLRRQNACISAEAGR